MVVLLVCQLVVEVLVEVIRGWRSKRLLVLQLDMMHLSTSKSQNTLEIAGSALL